MRFYIGSGIKNCELVLNYVEALKNNGWEHTYDWTKTITNEESIENLTRYAELEFQGIADSDVVIILLPAGRGAHIELGMAMALHKKIFLCSSMKEDFSLKNTVSFYESPCIVKLVGDVDEIIERIVHSF